MVLDINDRFPNRQIKKNIKHVQFESNTLELPGKTHGLTSHSNLLEDSNKQEENSTINQYFKTANSENRSSEGTEILYSDAELGR